MNTKLSQFLLLFFIGLMQQMYSMHPLKRMYFQFKSRCLKLPCFPLFSKKSTCYSLFKMCKRKKKKSNHCDALIYLIKNFDITKAREHFGQNENTNEKKLNKHNVTYIMMEQDIDVVKIDYIDFLLQNNINFFMKEEHKKGFITLFKNFSGIFNKQLVFGYINSWMLITHIKTMANDILFRSIDDKDSDHFHDTLKNLIMNTDYQNNIKNIEDFFSSKDLNVIAKDTF